MRTLTIGFLLMSWAVPPLQGQDLDPADVRVTLDSALRIAQQTASSAFTELSDYLLYSITPRVFKGDSSGLHWKVQWQQRAFPRRRWLVVRVYMKDGHTITERLDDNVRPSLNDASPGR